MMRSRSKEKSKDLGEQAAREKCLRLLSRRAHSSAELRTKLWAAGFPGEVSERVLAGLGESGLVDDEEFARAWVADRKLAGGWARRKLAWELRCKGIGREVIERVLAQDLDDEAELAQATALARKRFRGAPADGEHLTRFRRLLLGRGFGFETVDKVLESLSLEPESAPGETQDIARGEGETSR